MTAQIPDLFRYQGIEYSVSGISEGELFDPSLLGLKSVITSTACWRGYQAVFAVIDFRLVLDSLHVNLLADGKDNIRQEGPPINGILPTGPSQEHDEFNNHYLGIGYPLDYTGGLLLTDGFIYELYVQMGFHPAWKFTNIVELTFENGVLQYKFDRSERMAEIRQQILESIQDGDSIRMLPDEEIRMFVERSFNRTYKMIGP